MRKVFAYNTEGAVTIAHAIVEQYEKETKYPLSPTESDFLNSLLEVDDDEISDTNRSLGTSSVRKVPSSVFKTLWEGNEEDMNSLQPGRFEMNSVPTVKKYTNLQR